MSLAIIPQALTFLDNLLLSLMLLAELRDQLTSLQPGRQKSNAGATYLPLGLACCGACIGCLEMSSNRLLFSLQKKLKTQPVFPSSGLANGWTTRISMV